MWVFLICFRINNIEILIGNYRYVNWWECLVLLIIIYVYGILCKINLYRGIKIVRLIMESCMLYILENSCIYYVFW